MNRRFLASITVVAATAACFSLGAVTLTGQQAQPQAQLVGVFAVGTCFEVEGVEGGGGHVVSAGSCGMAVPCSACWRAISR